ncbi:hypothetical protein [Halocola ammonii]
MKPESLTILKKELKKCSPEETQEIVLRLARAKKENKELLTYLLSYAEDAAEYADDMQEHLDLAFEDLSHRPYFAAKTLRKVLREITKFKRFTKSDRYMVQLLLHFCERTVDHFGSSLRHQPTQGIIFRTMLKIRKALDKMHEDLQADFRPHFEEIVKTIDSKFTYWNAIRYNIRELTE